MKNKNLGTRLWCLPLGVGLALAISACGGSDSDGSNNNGGSSSAGTSAASGGSSATAHGGSSASNAGSSSSAGASGKAGSSSGGSGSSSGGSSSSSGGDFMSGLPADKPLSDLSDDEKNQLCDKVGDYFAGSVDELQCRLAALFSPTVFQAQTDAEARAACKTAYDACKAAPSETTQNCKDSGNTCTATVAEFEACASDTDAVIAAFNAQFPSCETLSLDDPPGSGSSDPSSVQEPASCTALEAKCPDGSGIDG